MKKQNSSWKNDVFKVDYKNSEVSIRNIFFEAYQAIENINKKLENNNDWRFSDFLPVLSIELTSGPFATNNILLINVYMFETKHTLYNSQEDDREYYEKTDAYENFEIYLNRKLTLLEDGLIEQIKLLQRKKKTQK